MRFDERARTEKASEALRCIADTDAAVGAAEWMAWARVVARDALRAMSEMTLAAIERQKPREWTLNPTVLVTVNPTPQGPFYTTIAPTAPRGECDLHVIEAAPVEREREALLDLLEACLPYIGEGEAASVRSALRKHGRLESR